MITKRVVLQIHDVTTRSTYMTSHQLENAIGGTDHPCHPRSVAQSILIARGSSTLGTNMTGAGDTDQPSRGLNQAIGIDLH
jgi:hypothetical protein